MAPTHCRMQGMVGRPIKWPTFLQLSADLIVCSPEAPWEVNMEVHIFDDANSRTAGTLSVWDGAQYRSGTYLVTNVYVATEPLRLFVPHDDCVRKVPEEYDGTDPMFQRLPWVRSILTGIGVVLTSTAKKITLCGFSYVGQDAKCKSWRIDCVPSDEDGEPFPSKKLASPLTLVNFEASVMEITQDGIPFCKLRRLNYLQPAPIALCEELGYTPAPHVHKRRARTEERFEEELGELKAMLSPDNDGHSGDKAQRATAPSSSSSSTGQKRRRTSEEQ
ncbi:hypothetical protein OC834_006158 [Tilletia horrida]|nr:hypothetical protein OC834_006158 [Tilletia horrida]